MYMSSVDDDDLEVGRASDKRKQGHSRLCSKVNARPDEIRAPEDLDLPPEAHEVFKRVTAIGAENFSREIVDALLKAQRKGNLRYVQDVVEAWYRTLVLIDAETHEEAVAWADAETSKVGFSVEELRDQLTS